MKIQIIIKTKIQKNKVFSLLKTKHSDVLFILLITVNVLKLRTLKNYYFSAVRSFRNYICEKMLVFEILECCLYHEKKNGICACQNVVETCWKHGDMILCYLLFYLFFNLIKNAAKFMRTETVKCPARAVFAKSRARHVHILSLNLLTSHKSPLI